MRESQHTKKRLTDSNFFDGLRSGAKRIHQRKAQAVSIAMLWQIAAQHNPLNHNFGEKGIPRITPFRDPNFAIVPCPNLLVSQIYTSRTSIGDERNTTQGEGMATQIPTNTDTTHTGLLHNITPSNHDFGKKGTWRITTSRTSISQSLNGQTSSRLKFTHHTHILKLNSPQRHGNHIPPPQPQQTKATNKPIAKWLGHMDRLPVRTVSEGRIAKEPYTKAAESKIAKKKDQKHH